MLVVKGSVWVFSGAGNAGPLPGAADCPDRSPGQRLPGPHPAGRHPHHLTLRGAPDSRQRHHLQELPHHAHWGHWLHHRNLHRRAGPGQGSEGIVSADVRPR